MIMGFTTCGRKPASVIDADSLRLSGLSVVATCGVYYEVKNGDYCPIPSGFKEDECLFLPIYAHGPFEIASYIAHEQDNPYDFTFPIIECSFSEFPYSEGFETGSSYYGARGRKAVFVGVHSESPITAWNKKTYVFQGYVRFYVIGAKRA